MFNILLENPAWLYGGGGVIAIVLLLIIRKVSKIVRVNALVLKYQKRAETDVSEARNAQTHLGLVQKALEKLAGGGDPKNVQDVLKSVKDVKIDGILLSGKLSANEAISRLKAVSRHLEEMVGKPVIPNITELTEWENLGYDVESAREVRTAYESTVNRLWSQQPS